MTATIIDLAARRAKLGPIRYKADAPCCAAARDDLGRLPIGYCGPKCVRRGWMPVAQDIVDVKAVDELPLFPTGGSE